MKTGKKILEPCLFLGLIASCLFVDVPLLSQTQKAHADDAGLKTCWAIKNASSSSNFITNRLNSLDNSYAGVGTSNSYRVCAAYCFGVPSSATIDGIKGQVGGERFQ